MTSLFPSAKESEDTTKGGMILIKIIPTDPVPASLKLDLHISYKDMQDNKIDETNTLEISPQGGMTPLHVVSTFLIRYL